MIYAYPTRVPCPRPGNPSVPWKMRREKKTRQPQPCPATPAAQALQCTPAHCYPQRCTCPENELNKVLTITLFARCPYR